MALEGVTADGERKLVKVDDQGRLILSPESV